MSGMARDNPLTPVGAEHWRIIANHRWAVRPVLLQRGAWAWGNCPDTGRVVKVFRVAYESEHETIDEATKVYAALERAAAPQHEVST